MNRIVVIFGTVLLSIVFLTACTSDSNKEKNTETAIEETEKKVGSDKSVETLGENKKEEDSADKNNDVDISSGEFKDQTDLKIGDTGRAASTIGNYEITLKSIKLQNELDGKKPLNAYLFITDLDIKNIGDKPINSEDIVTGLEITSNLEGSGYNDFSKFYKSLNVFNGEISPGETVSGQAIFDEMESEQYYIRITEGLVGSGAVKNQLIWNFSKSEVE